MTVEYSELTPDEIFDLIEQGQAKDLIDNHQFWVAMTRIHNPNLLNNSDNPYIRFVKWYEEATQSLNLATKDVVSLVKMNNSKRLEEKLKSLVIGAQEGVTPKLQDVNLNLILPLPINQSILAIAASRGYDDIVRILLKFGADVDLQNNEGFAALHLATFFDHYSVVEVLLENKGNANIKENFQCTPLHMAAQSNHTKIAKLLVKKGAQIDSLKVNNVTPFQQATLSGHLEAVEVLLDMGASINAISAFGTALRIATVDNKTILQEVLLKKGALIFLHPAHTEERNKQSLEPLLKYHREIDCSPQLGFALRQLLDYFDAGDEALKVMRDNLINSLLEHGPVLTIPECKVEHPNDNPRHLNFMQKVIKWEPELLKKVLARSDFDVNGLIHSAPEMGMKSSSTSIDYAILKNNDESIKLLLERQDLKLDSVTAALKESTYFLSRFISCQSSSIRQILSQLLSEKQIDINNQYDIETEVFFKEIDPLAAQAIKPYLKGCFFNQQPKTFRCTLLHLFALLPERRDLIPMLVEAGAAVEIPIEGYNNLTSLNILFGHRYYSYFNATAIRALFEAGAGICTSVGYFPQLDSDKQLLIGLKTYGSGIHSDLLTQKKPGYTKAITTLQELDKALHEGVEFKKELLIATCNRLLEKHTDPDILLTLKRIRSLLMWFRWSEAPLDQQLPDNHKRPSNTLNNRCLNALNFSAAFFDQRQAILGQRLYLCAQTPSPEILGHRSDSFITPEGLFQYVRKFHTLYGFNCYQCIMSKEELSQIGLTCLLEQSKERNLPSRLELNFEQLKALNAVIEKNGGRILNDNNLIPAELNQLLSTDIDKDTTLPVPVKPADSEPEARIPRLC